MNDIDNHFHLWRNLKILEGWVRKSDCADIRKCRPKNSHKFPRTFPTYTMCNMQELSR